MQDRISLKKLQTECIIGIFKRERVKKQKIRIDLELACDARKAATTDDIRDAVNYKQIAKWVLRKTQRSRFGLIESLAESLAGGILREFKVKSVKLTVWKPGAVRFSENVGVTIVRENVLPAKSGISAYVSFGSNVRKERSTRQAIEALRKNFDVSAISSVYESDPVGIEGEKFYNFVAEIHTDLKPEALRARLRKIEKDLGRVRTKDKFSPRPADLDIIFFGNEEPHPDWRLPHVLLPMAEIAPHFHHPELGRTMIECLALELQSPSFRKI